MKSIILLLAVSLTTLMTAGARSKEELRQLCMTATENADHRKALGYADELYRLAEADNDAFYKAYAIYYKGVSNILTGKTAEGRLQLEEADRMADNPPDDTLHLRVNNAYGIIEANRGNYDVARRYFFKSLDYVKKIRNEQMQTMVEANLAEIAYIRKDTTGLRYALDCYNRARSLGNERYTMFGAYHCANLFYMMRQPARALKYMKIAERLSAADYIDKAAIYRLRADIMSLMGNYAEAEKNLKLALAARSDAQAATVPEIYLSYARVKALQGLYSESNDLAGEGLRQADDMKAYAAMADLYAIMADNYEAMGDDQKALEAYKKYKSISDTIYNISKEHSINELSILYEIDKTEQNLVYQKQLLRQETAKTTFLLSTLLCLLGLSALLLYFYFRQKRLYKAIAQQNRDSVEREQLLREKLRGAEPAPAAAADDRQQLSDERINSIYDRVCELMEAERLYCDPDITRDKLARRLNTNRTYLSQVINARTGASYSRFINNYRIREAIRILSTDEGAAYPIKALSADLGFSSQATFYKLFQDTVGMTPSTYRKTISALPDNSPKEAEDV